MHTSSVILGKSLMGIVRGLIGGIIIILLGMLLTPGLFVSIWFILALLFSSLMFSILGVAAGLLAGSTPTLMMLNGLIILPMSFMCGTLFDVSALPGFAAAIIWALPLTHTSALLRAVATGG